MDIEKIMAYEELKNKLAAARAEAEKSGKTVEEYAKTLLPIFQEAGIETTEQEILDVLVLQNSKLSEDDLEKISGGGWLCCQHYSWCAHVCHANCDDKRS